MKNITEFIVNQDPPKNVSSQKEATKKPSISLKKDLGRGGVFFLELSNYRTFNLIKQYSSELGNYTYLSININICKYVFYMSL